MNLCFYLSNRVDTYIYVSIYDERRYLIAMHQIQVKSNAFQVPISTMTSHIYKIVMTFFIALLASHSSQRFLSYTEEKMKGLA